MGKRWCTVGLMGPAWGRGETGEQVLFAGNNDIVGKVTVRTVPHAQRFFDDRWHSVYDGTVLLYHLLLLFSPKRRALLLILVAYLVH